MPSYLLLNKPKGVITATRGGAGRRTVLDFIPFSLRPPDQSGSRWHSVGLLDGDSTGLVLLTDDGELARQLEHPKLGVLKEYRALCTGLAGDEQLQQLRAGMYLVNPAADGSKTTQRAQMESVRVLKRLVDRARGDRTLLGLSVRAGEPREIRRMLARVGLKLRELERVAIGPLRAAGLKPGATKLLGKKDVEKLREAVLSG
ncbi:MAG TPA: pseudouridine synthase [Steroidobacteraceae bacterium]|nr:pseudouridine synthase [Steroidobacteraceae bacterium]